MFIFENLVFPLLERFQPEALIIQGGADALEDDPMSRLCSFQPSYCTKYWVYFWDLSHRVILTGGGGYNPWTVSRLWTGFLGLDSVDAPIPESFTCSRPLDLLTITIVAKKNVAQRKLC